MRFRSGPRQRLCSGTGAIRMFQTIPTPTHPVASAKVVVLIPTPLRMRCAGESELAMTATNLRSLLDALERDFPNLYRCVCDETGSVRRHINLFVNRHHIRDREGIETRLVSGDHVTIMTAVSGG